MNHEPGQDSCDDAGFIWRPRWFLMNRFLAVAGVICAAAAAKFGFRIETIGYAAIMYLAILLLVLNIIYCAWNRLICRKGIFSGSVQNRLVIFTMTQINADLAILTLMLHFSGGATNPFAFYYIFHTVLSSILLPSGLAYLEAFTAAFLFCAMTVMEALGIVRHYALVESGIYRSPVFVAGIMAALSSALFIAVYMASSIMNRLRARQADLVRALNETARLEREKSHFLNVVAHDLKSPVATIETMIASILETYGRDIPEKARQILERVPIRTQELLRFIRELLDYSKIERYDENHFPFETVDLASLIADVLEAHSPIARSKKITLSMNSAPEASPVRGNRNLLEHMAANLVSNAIRYTREEGSVTIDLHSTDGWIAFDVSDTGIGIPAEDIPHVFDDFFRAANARKFNVTGTGLGLSITRGIVERHGGSIAVRSTPGEGTVFTVKIPRAMQFVPPNASLLVHDRDKTPHFIIRNSTAIPLFSKLYGIFKKLR